MAVADSGPASLAARVFLLTYDVTRQRFTARFQAGVLVRAAALTELFLSGRLRDVDGRPQAEPAGHDPVLTEIANSRPRRWAYWIGRGERAAVQAVREQLERDGLVRIESSRLLGIFPVTRVVVLDPMVVHRLREAVNRALDQGVPADRLDRTDVAMVALAVAGSVGTAVSRKTARRHKTRIAELTRLAGPAVPALRKVIQQRQAAAAG